MDKVSLRPRNTDGTTTSTSSMQLPFMQGPMENSNPTAIPALLQGSRSYVDASTSPDQVAAVPTTASLGIFILNFQVQPTQTIYIKATLTKCSSVIMAEAASLALASSITQAMNIHNCNFLSDCQQLVHFPNKDDLSNPPDWRIKHFTQVFSNHAAHTSSRIIKISRHLNTTADSLARQAYTSSALELHSLRITQPLLQHAMWPSLLCNASSTICRLA
jgi:hypothetical protein